MTSSGARDRELVDAVEEGGRPTFDGNHTAMVVSWIVPQPGNKWNGLNERQLDSLMEWTEAGHLAWVVLPIDNL